MQQQNDQTIFQLPLFIAAQALDLLDDVFDIRQTQVTGTKQRYLLLRPCVKIAAVIIGHILSVNENQLFLHFRKHIISYV
jgi:hypothetical protein